jgi:hypothetical protein
MVSFKKLREMVQVKGNGNIVSKTYPISSFLRLHIAVRGVTELIQSNEEKVEVELDENLAQYFDVQNAGRTLFVSTEGKILRANYTKVVTRIYFRQIDHLVVRCEGGNVICPKPLMLNSPLDVKIQSEGNTSLNLNAPQLKVVIQAQGDTTLMGDCGIVEIKNQSEGHLHARDLFTSELKLNNAAQGNVEVFADKKISIRHAGEGYIHYYGNAQLMDVRQYGTGEIKHCE